MHRIELREQGRGTGVHVGGVAAGATMTSPAETRAGKCCSSAPGTDGIGVPDSTGTGAGRRYEGDIAVVGQTVAVGRTEHSVGSRGAAWKVVGRNRRVGQSPALARLERRATPQRHMVKVVRPVGGCSCRTEDCQTCLEECVRRQWSRLDRGRERGVSVSLWRRSSVKH